MSAADARAHARDDNPAHGDPARSDNPPHGDPAHDDTPARAGILAHDVLAALVARNQTLATAESLTGGGIGELLTSVAGASRAYRGGVITYATDLKASLAGVEPAVLERDGPVAPTTAGQMATGAARRCGADWGLAVTGVAGPDAQDGHQAGHVFVGLAQPGAGVLEVHELALTGDRAAIRARTATAALGRLLELLQV